MTSRILRCKRDLADWMELLNARKLPLSVSAVSGRVRTTEQNKLQRLWLNEIAQQLGDQTPEEVRGYCKLTMGVPILRAENPAFEAAYDANVRPLPYEQKLALMMVPLDLPVTRLMNVWQHVRFLDHMHRHFAEQGLRLTEPDPAFASDVAQAQKRMAQP